MSKQNDYFLNLLYNPEFSPGDFLTIGLNSGNTSIENKEEYKELDFVKNNPLLQTDGKFDEKKFDKLYQQSLTGYNLLSRADSNEKLTTSYAAFRDDIFSDPANRRQGSETFITKIANPNRQLIGFVSRNIMEAPKQSVREIAQDRLVWDGSTNSWVDAPNDTTINNFLNPKVLALYDEDVDINGKVKGEQGFDSDNIAHHKGEKKINPLTGTYYYETLNGRSIYGRDVLSGWDTLTKDGSWVNKYDFFDSDDLEKSTSGSLLKSVVKVAPALIPAVSPWYIGARVILGASDLFAKIGKMTFGSDSPALSYLEGINAAWTQSTSDYSAGSQEMGLQGHAWSIENLLNLSADVFTLLAEQRWMFTHVPSLLSGSKLGFSKEAQEAFKLKEAEKIRERFKGLTNESALNPFERAIDLNTGSMLEAQAMLESKLQAGNKFGEHLSKLYMTGITVADSYGEAKELGLSDIEAALFTLGYAAGEYGILSTNLGEHILPELRAEKRRYQNIARTLQRVEGVSEEVKKDTRKWYLKLIDFGKQAAVGDYNDSKIAAALKAESTKKAFGLSVASNALGEGMEEVSEELLFDISKLLYNAAANLGMTSTGATMETFDGFDLELVMNRYALNFVGGLAGGAIAVGLPGFQEGIKNMLGTNMDKKQAYQELVALIRNGKKDDFLRTVKKLELADSNLSATEFEVVDGEAHYKPGNSNNNKDVANKTVLEGMVNLIDNLLTINGVKMDDDSILSKLTGAKELARFLTLVGGDTEGSATLANYLQDFNTLSTKIANLAVQIDAIKHPRVDLKGKSEAISQEGAGLVNDLQSQLNELIKLRDAYLNGDMSKIVLPKVIFEMSPIIASPYLATNFKDYAEKVENKIISEIPEDRLKQLKSAWENYKSNGFKDDIEYAYQNFMLITEKFSDKLKEFDLSYFKNPQDLQQTLGNLFMNTERIITEPSNDPEDIQANTLSYEQVQGVAKFPAIQANFQALAALTRAIGLNDEFETIRVLQNFPNDISAITDANVLNEIKELGRKIGITFDETADSANSDLRKIQETYLLKFLDDILINEGEKIKEALNSISYFNEATRDFLNNRFFRRMLDNLDYEDEDEFDYNEKVTNLYNEYKNIINNKPTTPIELLADLFLLSIGDSNVPISKLIQTLQLNMSQKASQGIIDEFGFGTDVAEQINNALKVLELLGSHVLGARNDSGKLGNIFGFNSTVNQLNSEANLAEIDKDVANTLMLDIAKLQSKLDYFKTIFNVNSGQKLVEQKKIANRINAHFINKIKQIVQATPEIPSAIPDDWNELDESGVGLLDKLKAALGRATVFESIISSNDDARYNLTLEQANALEKEAIDILDALYDLFNNQKNIERLENGELNLSKLMFIPSTAEVSTTYNGTMIDSSLEGFDDRTALMMLATAASVKASEFYAEYKNSLIDGIAPIPGQELAIKMAYSFLLNKPMFLRFGKAYNDKILEEVKGVNSALLWKLYQKNVDPEGKLDNSYALLFLNTFLVEGIAGSGN